MRNGVKLLFHSIRKMLDSVQLPSRLMKNASLGNRERADVGIEEPLDADSE